MVVLEFILVITFFWESGVGRIQRKFCSALEWVIAAAFLLISLLIGSFVWHEHSVLTASVASISGDQVTRLPSGLPVRAISVPVLLLLDGKEVRLGDTATHVAALLGRAAEVGKQHVDHGPLGQRFTRFYEHSSTRFLLAFEPVERNGEPRVSWIYLH